jgi:membrane protease YdiL (CAAX protease family)
MENVSALGLLATLAFVIGAAIFSMLLIAQTPAAFDLVRRVSGEQGLYDPRSGVHNTAVILALALLSNTVGSFVLGGGLSGLAQELQTSGISAVETLLAATLQIAIAFFGVGLAIRRALAGSLQRLGLRPPTRQDVTWGIRIGIALYVVRVMFVLVWQQYTSAEQLDEQLRASQELARTFDTLPLALVASLSAALGEEIFVRGALQPVFGLLATSAFFALLHTQYLITPGLVLIFLISLGLGWLRLRQSTTAAIIAHFVYNFVQFVLLLLLPTIAG